MKKKVFSLLFASLLIASSASAESYSVQQGDSLYKISHKFGVTIDQIKKENKLSSDIIQIGQKLSIPGNDGNSQLKRQTIHTEKSSRSLGLMLNRFTDLATSLVGIPYRYGGTTTKGFDCSGYTSYVMGAFGVNLPRTSSEQFSVGESVARDDLRAGDLLFFDTMGSGHITHVGIYLGNNKMIHSATKRVEIDDLSWYFNHYKYYGAKRTLGIE